MLKRRHIAGTLYLGVAKDKTKTEGLAAHAWLRCGNIILTGPGGPSSIHCGCYVFLKKHFFQLAKFERSARRSDPTLATRCE